MNKETQQQADEILTEYVRDRFIEAYERVEREMKGEGCGCPACAYGSVDDINAWTDFVSKDGADHLHYKIKIVQGRPTIIPPED